MQVDRAAAGMNGYIRLRAATYIRAAKVVVDGTGAGLRTQMKRGS